MFTEKERAYLGSQRLARLATVSPSGQPDADVVGFELDGDDILIGSYQNLAGSRKYKNVAAGGEQGFAHRRQPRLGRSHGPGRGEDPRHGVDRAAQRPVWTNGVHRRPAADVVELGRRGPAFVDGTLAAPHKQTRS